MLFDLEPGVIDAARASSLGCLIRPGISLVGKTGLTFAPRKPYILTPPRCTSAESFSSCCDSVAALALFFDSVAALALASCNEHVAEAIFLRPHPPTPRVHCTVPTQSSKLERSEKQLNFLVR